MVDVDVCVRLSLRLLLNTEECCKVFELKWPGESENNNNNNNNWQLYGEILFTINERLEGLKFLWVPAPIVRRSF
jgi:hypothetical protein